MLSIIADHMYCAEAHHVWRTKTPTLYCPSPNFFFSKGLFLSAQSQIVEQLNVLYFNASMRFKFWVELNENS